MLRWRVPRRSAPRRSWARRAPRAPRAASSPPRTRSPASCTPPGRGRWLGSSRGAGRLVGAGAALAPPVIRAAAGILENFREAYLVVARTAAAQEEWPILQSALVQRMQRQFQTSLLLGEVHKPEGNSMITFGNALSRLAELGHVAVVRGGRGGRERWVDRGPAFDQLPELIRHFGT